MCCSGSRPASPADVLAQAIAALSSQSLTANLTAAVTTLHAAEHVYLVGPPEITSVKPQTKNPKTQTKTPKPQIPSPKPQTPNPGP